MFMMVYNIMTTYVYYIPKQDEITRSVAASLLLTYHDNLSIILYFYGLDLHF